MAALRHIMDDRHTVNRDDGTTVDTEAAAGAQPELA